MHSWCLITMLRLTPPRHTQTQIQRLLKLGVRSSYSKSVLDCINELSLPELIVEGAVARMPVRTRLPDSGEWVQVCS